jgi:hypothetical protein
MNVMDAVCMKCGVSIRWLSGDPRLCGRCSQLSRDAGLEVVLVLSPSRDAEVDEVIPVQKLAPAREECGA